jgi:hypothetical protein
MATSAVTSDLPAENLAAQTGQGSSRYEFSVILESLEGIISVMDPVFTKLTPDQRRARNAVGIKRIGFIDTAREIALKNTEYLPNFFDIQAFKQDVECVHELMQLHNEANKLIEYLKGAEVIFGNEVYRSALSIHRYLREAARSGMSGAKPLYQRTKRQFPNGRVPNMIEEPVKEAGGN